jgi:Cu(I)/Ag(I) efflux system membrane protein CusA/SilA
VILSAGAGPAVPFALVGSVWALWLLKYNLSTAVWVGVIALVGLAAQTGVVMIVYIDHAYERRLAAGTINSIDDIIDAHSEGTIQRVRPKLMTVSTMMFGLVPLLWAQGSGADVMKRIAAPMVGGLVTSAFLTLEIIPVIYTYWRNEQLLWRQLEERALPILRWMQRIVLALKSVTGVAFVWGAARLYSRSLPTWIPQLGVSIVAVGVGLLATYLLLRRRAVPLVRDL